MIATTTLAPMYQVTDANRRQLDDDGFFITPVLFDEETLEGVRREFKRMWDAMVEGAIKTGDPLTIEQAKYRPFMSQLDYKSQACRAFCHHPVFQNLAAQVVGPDIDVTWNQAILKPPVPPGHGDNAFAWHQDPWYATHGDYKNDCDWNKLIDPDNSMTAWAAISRTTVDNGTLWVLPGRHKENLLPHVWSEEKREWQGQFDTSYKIPVVMRAGQVLIFKKYLPHGSGTNISDEVRMAYQIGYSVPGVKLQPSKDMSPLLRGNQVVEREPLKV